ncbi:MAG: transporter substrate-binding domain-containing protein [Alphaproteobacteria bacterium]|nr:transporter substrate-binding domain-containing protein [Alphaproteobacteria bacterium]
MIQKIIAFILGFFFILSTSNAAEVNIGITAIQNRHHVVCGIDRNYKHLADKQNNEWNGFDVDICRAVAAATIGNAESFKLLYVSKENISTALNSGKVDIILGNHMLSPKEEKDMFVLPVSPLYINKIIFAARATKEALSMKDYAHSKVCVLRNSPVQALLETYNQDHALGFNLLELPTTASLKEAFYLKRCDLISGDEVFIKSIVIDLKNSDAEILPEVIGYIPVKAYSSGYNSRFNTILNTILNSLKYAHQEHIFSQNIETFKMSKSTAVQNLLGYNKNFWNSLSISPQWATDYISVYGNYNQLLEKNLGQLSVLELDQKHNDLIENGGFLTAIPLI